MKPLTIAVDFDGTIVEHDYPGIGSPVPHALDTLDELQKAGHRLILWTMRSGDQLEEAVDYLYSNGIRLYGANKNPQQDWTTSPKQYAHIYIDDAALGCPLLYEDGERPMVDWYEVRKHLVARGVLK